MTRSANQPSLPRVPSQLPEAATYGELRSRFRWELPERFNIAVACCDAWAAAAPDRPCLIHDPLGATRTLTYGELRKRADALAWDMKRRGIGPGDRVALLLPQGFDGAVAHMAVYKLGAIALPLALLFGSDAVAHRLETAGAKAIVTTNEGLAKLKGMGRRPRTLEIVYSTDGADGGVIDLAGAQRADTPFLTVETGPNDPALMIFTSGTTGPPKGALHGHRVLIGHIPGVQTHHMPLPLDGDVLWTPADWAWAGGLLNVLLPGLALGVPVVSTPPAKFDPEAAFAVMERARVTRVFMPPTALRILATVNAPSDRLHLRTVGSGGEQLGAPTHAWARDALGVTVNEFYGQTECNLVLSGCAALGVVDADAIGRPVPGHDVAILGPDGVPLADGERGEIAIRAPDPVMFLRYWDQEQATREKYKNDWLLTGDQGWRDDRGLFHFQGRDDDIITSAGFRIGPGEIEDCLNGHPDVALSAAVGVPHPVRTQIVKAFVVLQAGVEPSERAKGALSEYVRSRLSAHEYPREIEFVDELPLTVTGKVVRRELRDRASAA